MQLTGAKCLGAIVAGHLWLVGAIMAAPAALASITAIVLVLSVERGERVEAIKALPPVVSEVNKSRLSGLVALPCRTQRRHRPAAGTGHGEQVPGLEQRRVEQ